jgi:hypothetical protein
MTEINHEDQTLSGHRVPRFSVHGEEVTLVDFDAAWVDNRKWCEVAYANGKRELREWADISVEYVNG